MKKIKIGMHALLLILLISGCGSLGSLYVFRGNGLLYTHTVQPLTLHRTPVRVSSDSSAQGDRKGLQIRYITVVWDDDAIGEIARSSGIKTINYADLETRSILGVWSRHIVRIYGTDEEPPGAPSGK